MIRLLLGEAAISGCEHAASSKLNPLFLTIYLLQHINHLMSNPKEPSNDLASEIGKRLPFASLRQETTLNLVRTYSKLSGEFSQLFKKYGISDSKYNALRILQGEGRPMQVYQIADRMLNPQTDVTRLMERLENDGFITRERCEQDRRVVWVTLTSQGKAILKKLEKPVADLHETHFHSLSQQELEMLNQLLFKARA